MMSEAEKLASIIEGISQPLTLQICGTCIESGEFSNATRAKWLIYAKEVRLDELNGVLSELELVAQQLQANPLDRQLEAKNKRLAKLLKQYQTLQIKDVLSDEELVRLESLAQDINALESELTLGLARAQRERYEAIANNQRLLAESLHRRLTIFLRFIHSITHSPVDIDDWLSSATSLDFANAEEVVVRGNYLWTLSPSQRRVLSRKLQTLSNGFTAGELNQQL